ncbi:MAG TPA: methionine biosynthesis protein MetW [Acidimicrobiia bacterium]|nr:methionine biosynthesis protein MetW [Acidimicrobiia bacterium]
MTDLDLAQLRAEIAAEVRARRASGEYSPGLERRLDALFTRFSPPETHDDFDASIERAEDLVVIDPEIPVASQRTSFGIVKRVLARLLSWYHAWLTHQIASLATAMLNAVRVLGRRVERLEHAIDVDATGRGVLGRLPAVRDDARWGDTVVRALEGRAGRVAVIECGDGALVKRLTDKGVDAYGVEPRTTAADEARATGVEVRSDEPGAHLRGVAKHALAGVVLRGFVERTGAGELFNVVEQSITAIDPGGTLIVCSVSPDAWGTGATAAEADLASGRPLHAATWEQVLRDLGLHDVRVETLDDAYVVTATVS